MQSWKNIENYIGLAYKKVPTAFNNASQTRKEAQLLRLVDERFIISLQCLGDLVHCALL